MQYGFQRLVLLGSAGYSRAELPLDGSVSLVAPNNIGKTSLINALQFLLIIHRSRMDFGAHNFDASRRFYFPNNSAYVMLEISLPETGTVVLGCVGKGVSFDYEYFAYAGSLNVEEFCLPNGQLVAQPQLINHLANHGRRVFAYNSSDFADMIYGGRRSRSNGQQDFCVFRLEHANDASVFQRVMTRTLRLDKLTSREVKDYLLKIFKRDLPDAGIDFKAEWDKAFADLNTERAQYLAAVTLKNSLDQLESKQQQRKILRGKIIYWQPLIEEALSSWQQYYQDQKQQLQSELGQCSLKWKQQREDDLHAARSQTELEVEKKQLLAQKNQLQQLQQRFMLINDRSVLESNRDRIAQQRDDLVVSIGQAQNSSVHYTKQQLQRVERELAQINQEIATQGQNLYQHLSKHLSHSQLVALNKVFSRSVLTLGTNAFRIDERALLSVLDLANEQNLELPGLSLNIGSLLEQHQQLTAAQLQERQQQILQEQYVLEQQLVSAQALEEIKSQRSKLEQELKHIDNELQAYQSMEALLQDQLVREERLQDLGCMIESLVIQLAQAEERNQALHQMQQQLEQKLITLEQQHKQIEQRRDQRIDQEPPLSWVSDLPHQPWLVQTEFQLHQLAEYLQSYLNDCKKIVELDEQIRQLLSQIHLGGLTKYQLIGDEESEIERLIAFAHHLPQEAEALEKKARSAVVNVAACLRELRDGLLAFKRRMREFNRKISGRQLSDLAVFKIEPEDEAPLVEAIELLIKTATTVDTGEVFDLFNQQSVLDDVQINRAKTLLIEEGNARNGLHITDLFHLRFWVGKANQEAEAFDDLDSAASNGTVLMAKLVTGLAMLHLMQDQRRPIQGVCYLDEALALDSRNQRNLIEIAAEFGFSLIFASPAPLTTVRYCVPIHQKHGKNQISRFSWQIIETLEATS